jgi:hypothetical protein
MVMNVLTLPDDIGFAVAKEVITGLVHKLNYYPIGFLQIVKNYEFVFALSPDKLRE